MNENQQRMRSAVINATSRATVALDSVFKTFEPIITGAFVIWSVFWWFVGKIAKPKIGISAFFIILAPIQLYFATSVDRATGIDIVAEGYVSQLAYIAFLGFMGWLVGNFDRPMVQALGAIVILHYAGVILLGTMSGDIGIGGILAVVYLTFIVWLILAVSYMYFEIKRLEKEALKKVVANESVTAIPSG